MVLLRMWSILMYQYLWLSQLFVHYFQSTNDVLMRKARGILNKLCPQKFDRLVEKFNELQIDTEEKLRLCMELVFEKVISTFKIFFQIKDTRSK